MVQVSAQSLSKYENDHQTPRWETVDRLARTLGLPEQYFFRPHNAADLRPVFCRSKLTAQSVDLARALVRLRSEERRVGQACVRRCRSRWSAYHSITKVK